MESNTGKLNEYVKALKHHTDYCNKLVIAKLDELADATVTINTLPLDTLQVLQKWEATLNTVSDFVNEIDVEIKEFTTPKVDAKKAKLMNQLHDLYVIATLLPNFKDAELAQQLSDTLEPQLGEIIQELHLIDPIELDKTLKSYMKK